MNLQAIFKIFLFIFIGVLLVVEPQALKAQNAEKYVLHIKKATAPIKVDGILDEASWDDADVAKDFYRVLPMDTGYAESKTEVRMTYDDKNIYMAVICWDPLPGENIIASLRRDFQFPVNDNFLAFIDPFEDKTNGFSFGASAAGAQWDGLQSDGGTVGLEWDNKWESEVVKEDGRHIHEFGIPFKTIRYKAGIDKWGINFSRLDLKRNEKSSWAPVPRQFATASLAFAGTLQWDNPPPPAGPNVSLIPYVSNRISKDHESNSETDHDFDAGLDAKIGITSSLNLDLTVNPDFSQVEVDQQVTNLSRFELFFPEKRQFFLENSDLFANFGYRDARPFFSRRIGLESPIIAGARLSGKISKDWRVGLMNMATDRVDSTNFPSQNYLVAALQRQVFSRSNLAFIFVDRDAIDYQPEDTVVNKWNRVAGVDFNLFTADNLWQGKAYLHGSATQDKKDISHAVQLEYKGQNLEFEWEHQYVGEDFTADVGFVPRTGYTRLNPDIGYAWYPKSKVVNRHGPTMRNQAILTNGIGLTDYSMTIQYELLLLNTASYSLEYEESYIELIDPFDPTNSGKDTLATGTDYQVRTIGASIESNKRKLFTYQLSGSYGGYFNGNRENFSASLNYRFQPYGSISLDMDYNRLIFPDEANNSTFLLVGPKFDITFTNKIFWTTWVQYNDQVDNININSRFQWRYAPVSDLFIVYTDNYNSDFGVKNRALVVKLNYWLNL
jgi:hypothetical protein